MRTLKPACASVITRCIEHQQRYYLGVSVLTHIPLLGNARLGAEQALWPMLAKYAPEFIEEAIPRTRSEFLLYGNVYPPQRDEQAAYTDFGIRVGQLSRKARAFGRRVMDGADLRVQDPMVPVSIVPENAYGGPAYAENLSGSGHPSSKKQGLIELPKIELLSHAWQAEPQMNQSALFGQIDIMHPLRQRLSGTYGDEWLKKNYPGMPDDSNWAIFNTALPEQQQQPAFTGDEVFDLINLRTDHAHISNSLPGIGARVLVQLKQKNDEFSDLSTSLRSLVFLPEANALVMVWQAQCQIETDDASDVELIMLGFDHLSSPRSVDHYLATRDSFLDDEDGMLTSLDESPLVPEGIEYDSLLGNLPDLNTPVDPNSIAARQRRRAERGMQEARNKVIALGMDPDEHAPPEHLPPLPVFPPVPELGPFFRKMEDEAEEKRIIADESREEMIALAAEKYEAQGLDFNDIRSEMAAGEPGPGPPKSRKHETLKTLRAVDAQARAQGEPIQEIEEMLADTALHEQWAEADKQLLTGYRMGAHYQSPCSRLEDKQSNNMRSLVENRIQAGESLEGLDLSGADLSGINLAGMDCRGVLMESANLQQANLSKACFVDAVLAHANLQGANLQDCDFNDANLGKANLEGVDASRASFIGAQLEKTVFKNAVMSAAIFRDSQWFKLNLSQCDLSGSDFREAQLLDCNLAGSRFNGALLAEAAFVDCNYENSSWQNCSGENVSFVNISASGIDFSGANLPGSRWVGDVNLEKARFIQAELKNAYFGQESLLSGANFEQVKAANCDFTGCNLTAAIFRGAYLRGASLRKAQLSLADLSNADLMDVSLQNALLQGAKLLGTHLYAADLARIQVDHHTQSEAAIYTKARVYPKYQPPPSS